MLLARLNGWLAVNYYSFHIGDYRRDTAHLTPIEHYIYRTLIDWYFLNETPIPKETQVVIRRLSLGSDMIPNLENVLNDFFVLDESGWRHGRIDREICEYHTKAEINRVNGKLGGRPKKTKKTQTVSERLANDNPTESESNPNQEPITINHIKDISLTESVNAFSEKSDEKRRTKKNSVETPIPDDFSISTGVLSWYAKHGYTEDISQHLENFIDTCKAKNYLYADFDSAFKGAIRKDWAGLRNTGQKQNSYVTNQIQRGNDYNPAMKRVI